MEADLINIPDEIGYNDIKYVQYLLTTAEFRSIENLKEKGRIIYETGNYSIRCLAGILGLDKSTLNNYINHKHLNRVGRPLILDEDQKDDLKSWIIQNCMENNTQSANQIGLKVQLVVIITIFDFQIASMLHPSIIDIEQLNLHVPSRTYVLDFLNSDEDLKGRSRW